MVRALIRPALLLAALLPLAGCLIDGAIDAKGAGTATIKYRLTNEAQLDAMKKRFESPAVTCTSATIDKDKNATFDIKFDDVTKLSTTQFFGATTIALADGDGGTRVLTIKYANKSPSKLPDEMVTYFGKDFQVTIKLPGDVVKTNATESKGPTATWKWGLNDFLALAETELNATFKTAAAKH